MRIGHGFRSLAKQQKTELFGRRNLINLQKIRMIPSLVIPKLNHITVGAHSGPIIPRKPNKPTSTPMHTARSNAFRASPKVAHSGSGLMTSQSTEALPLGFVLCIQMLTFFVASQGGVICFGLFSGFSLRNHRCSPLRTRIIEFLSRSK